MSRMKVSVRACLDQTFVKLESHGVFGTPVSVTFQWREDIQSFRKTARIAATRLCNGRNASKATARL